MLPWVLLLGGLIGGALLVVVGLWAGDPLAVAVGVALILGSIYVRLRPPPTRSRDT